LQNFSKNAKFSCPCGKRDYCSKRCQKEHWRWCHKLECTHNTATESPLTADQWSRLHSLYLSADKDYKLIRYAHTGRPLVRYGWYPSASIPPGKKIPREVHFPEKGHSYIPVCRYEDFAQGMARLDVRKKSKYCGRFLFYEPNSATLLDLKSCVCFPTKVAAFYALKVRSFLQKNHIYFFPP